MKNFGVVLRVLFTTACISGGILAFAKAFAPNAHAAGVVNLHGKVTRVVDGDTIHLENDKSDRFQGQPHQPAIRVRMLQIDAPESHFSPQPGQPPQAQPYGKEAGEHLAKLVPVGSLATVASFGKDKYERTLGLVLYKQKNVNLKMVADGMAIPYVICEGKRCTPDFFEKEKISLYFKACDYARKHNLGIWNSEKPLKEMPYEFRLRLSGRKPEKYVGDFETRKLYIPTEYKKVDVCSRVFFMTKKDAVNVGYE